MILFWAIHNNYFCYNVILLFDFGEKKKVKKKKGNPVQWAVSSHTSAAESETLQI